MKKLLLVIISLTLILGVGACSDTSTDPSTDELDALTARVEVLEAQILEVEEILISLGVIPGLNDQKAYYIIPEYSTGILQGVSASETTYLADEVDKDKAPAYTLDVNGDYVPFIDVANLLIDKYFGEDVQIYDARVGYQIKIVLFETDYTQEEYMARLILMIEELSLYDAYIIGGSELYIQTNFEGTSYLKIPVHIIRSDYINITPYSIYNGLYEVEIFRMDYDNVLVQEYYDSYILNETFSGYVLDYK